MARVQKIGLYGKYRPTGPDQSYLKKVQGLAGFVNLGKTVVSELEGPATQERIEKGKKEGLAKGAKGEYEEMSTGGSIYSTAYNEAMQTSYLATQDIEAKEQLSSIMTRNHTNLDGYMAEAQGMKKGILDNTPEEMKAIVAMSLDEMISTGRNAVEKQQYTSNMNNAQNEITAALESGQSYVETLMASGDFDNVMPEINKQRAKLQELLRMNQADGRYGITQSVYDERMRKIDVSSAIAGNRGLLKDTFLNNGIGAANDFYVNSLLRQKPLDQFTQDDMDNLNDQLSADLRKYASSITRNQALSDRQLKEFQTSNYADIEQRINDGDETITQQFLTQQLRSNNITEAQYSKASKRLATMGFGVTDVRAYNGVMQLIDNSEYGRAFDVIESLKDNLQLTDADYRTLRNTVNEERQKDDSPINRRMKNLRNLIRSQFQGQRDQAFGLLTDSTMAQREQLTLMTFQRVFDETGSADLAYKEATSFAGALKNYKTKWATTEDYMEYVQQQLQAGTPEDPKTVDETTRKIMMYNDYLAGKEIAAEIDAYYKEVKGLLDE